MLAGVGQDTAVGVELDMVVGVELDMLVGVGQDIVGVELDTVDMQDYGVLL